MITATGVTAFVEAANLGPGVRRPVGPAEVAHAGNQRETGFMRSLQLSGLPLVRLPSPGPVCPGAGIAPDRGKPLACGICHVPCLLPVLPVHRRRAALFPLFWSAGFPSFTGEGKTHQTI